MAEGWMRHLRNDEFEPYSAGIEKHGLNSYAVKVMKEAGVDISKQCSKTVFELEKIDFDYVITLCDNARETCPIFFGDAKVMHNGFDNPPALAKNMDREDDRLNCYRKVRDEIRAFVENLS